MKYLKTPKRLKESKKHNILSGLLATATTLSPSCKPNADEIAKRERAKAASIEAVEKEMAKSITAAREMSLTDSIIRSAIIEGKVIKYQGVDCQIIDKEEIPSGRSDTFNLVLRSIGKNKKNENGELVHSFYSININDIKDYINSEIDKIKRLDIEKKHKNADLKKERVLKIKKAIENGDVIKFTDAQDKDLKFGYKFFTPGSIAIDCQILKKFDNKIILKSVEKIEVWNPEIDSLACHVNLFFEVDILDERIHF